MSAPVVVRTVVVDEETGMDYRGYGYYFGDGHLELRRAGVTLLWSGQNLCSDNPKRLRDVEKQVWSTYLLKSMVLDGKSLTKTENR